jgi:hypothetical protein
MADKIIRYLHITYPTNLGYNIMNLASMEASITDDVMQEIDVNGVNYDKQNKVYAVTFSFADSISNTVRKANERVSDAVENIIDRINADEFGLEAWLDGNGVIQVKKGGK